LIEDYYNAGSSWVFAWRRLFWRAVEHDDFAPAPGKALCSGALSDTKGLPLEKWTHRTRMWNLLGAGCALALACACAPPAALAQQSAADSNSTGVKTGSAAPAKTNPASHAPAGTQAKSSATAATHNSKSKSASLRRKSRRKTTARGQQKIDPERAQEIQQALIREHYLNGEASGSWNQASEDAMRRYQADHGWQSKTVPDSRALISLGLGPSHDHLLNPESAMTSGLDAPRASVNSGSQSPASHSADSGTRVNASPSAPPADPPPASTAPHDAARPQ
jgi:hypothetical protein